MLTAAVILHTASTRGIFATPTRAGETGPVLLASLGIDLSSAGVAGDLIRLNAAREIGLDGVYLEEIEPSLRLRGADSILVGTIGVCDGDRIYHAIIAPAVPTTGEELTEEEIASVYRIVNGNDPDLTRCCWIARGYESASAPPLPWSERAEARARIAAAINHRRGVLP